MEFIKEYKYLIIPITIWFLIQLFKLICDIIKTKQFNIKRILGAGGMPSSHSAVVTSLATLIGKYEGINSPIFGVAAILACIVMYDAAGVRRAAGNQAQLLNKIVQTSELSSLKPEEKLVEVLGHTPIQVIVGAIIGIGAGLIF